MGRGAADGQHEVRTAIGEHELRTDKLSAAISAPSGTAINVEVL